jgi:hypothetical protein
VKMCRIDGCDRPVGKKGARGMCSRHYKRWRGTGRPEYDLRGPLAVRFARSVPVASPDDCWEWTGHRDKDGYGRIGSGGKRSKPLRATRVQWELTHGEPIPDGLWVLHRCDNPPCVNPAHLFLGSVGDNQRDAAQKGRLPGRKHGVRAQYKLTNEQIAAIVAAGNPWRGSRHVLAQQYGVSYQHIRAIQLGERRIKQAPDDYGQRAS